MGFLRAFGLCVATCLSMAFVAQGPRGGGDTAIDHLERAPRWAVTNISLTLGGERGLGGGLEYAVDDSLCKLRMVDGSSCLQIKQAIVDAFDAWSSGHPDLVFVDVSDAISPTFPFATHRAAGLGSEIDFFAANRRQFVWFRQNNRTGYTNFTEANIGKYQLTNGSETTGALAMESADIWLNSERCYFIELTTDKPFCAHLPSVLLHEIGHALGIGHPEEFPGFNLDQDGSFATPVDIDCENPTNGLKPVDTYQATSVMNGQNVQSAGRWKRGLTYDDIAGRDALYPSCGIEPVQRFSSQWGAYARGPGGLVGKARKEPKADNAAAFAQSMCRGNESGACETVAVFEECFAFAEGRSGANGQAVAASAKAARVNAVLACQKADKKCKITTSFCAFD